MAIVPSHSPAVAKCGDLSRLDLIEWRCEDWCDAQIDAFAPDYDGSLWFLGAKGDFYAIDAHSKSFDALWRVPDAGGRVLSVARSESSCSFLTASSEWVRFRAVDLPASIIDFAKSYIAA